MITFADYFYSKYYCGRSTTMPDAKGEATAHAAGHNHRHKGLARFCSLDFSERHKYLRGLARFRSLDFGERNGYLKEIAPIDAQQKSMELLTFSCSRGSSWEGTLPPRYGHHG